MRSAPGVRSYEAQTIGMVNAHVAGHLFALRLVSTITLASVLSVRDSRIRVTMAWTQRVVESVPRVMQRI